MTFTFTSDTARNIIGNVTTSLVLAQALSDEARCHVRQIIRELNGAPFDYLPQTWSDVATTNDVFASRHGMPLLDVRGSGLRSSAYTDYYLKARGCTVIGEMVSYLSEHDNALAQHEAATMVAARRRVLEVHLARVHNVPTTELARFPNLVQYHTELENEFRLVATSRPLPAYVR